MTSINLNGVVFNVNRSTVFTSVQRRHAIRKLTDGLKITDFDAVDPVIVELVIDYGRVVTQVQTDNRPEWLAQHTDSAEQLTTAFNAWCELPESEFRALSDAIKAVNDPQTEEHLTPNATPQKKVK